MSDQEAARKEASADLVDLSIVIVSWNTRALLAQCLTSIALFPPTGSYEVIVVDNASSDGTVAMVRTDFPNVRLVTNEVNKGFAGGNNQALRRSRGRYVLLLNPDTEVRPAALDVLIDFMDEHPRAGAAGARLLNPDGSLQNSCSPAPTVMGELLHLFHLDRQRRYGMARWDRQTEREVDILLGACLMVRREALHEVGSLDESFFMYSEEVDFCFRLQQAGWPLFWVPRAEVVHYGGQSTQQAATQMFLQLYENKLNYFRKHYGLGAGRRYKAVLLLAALSRLALSPLALLEQRERRRKHLALAARYGRLLRALPLL